MSYSAQVLQLLLSAPGDLPDQHKDVIQRAIRLWNNEQARFYQIHFSPTDWKEGGIPEFGDYAQGVLNDQIVDDSDAGIVVFTDRLGTPTPEHESGTAEEIHRLRAASKDVAVLQNVVPRAPLVGSAALEERARLERYLQKIQPHAYVAKYDSEQRLSEVVTRLMTRIAGKYRREAEASLISEDSETPRSDLEDEPDDPSKGVWPRVEVGDGRKWRIVLENNMDQPVSDVTLRYEDASGAESNDFDLFARRHRPVEILPPQGSVAYPIVQAFGSPDSAIAVIGWMDPNGVRRETRATVRTF